MAAHLEGLGVEFRRGAPVEGIRGGRRVTGATVGGETVTADRYVAAVPVEVMRLLASPQLRAPSRGSSGSTSWSRAG